ncbi:hypothetical protein CAP35_06795 [Chitinophagaceae bacterium IBVUCB1]|nr:hypothetical protein CAP35_06795 [Chitinophagaceae bacterium IBVUCB1]
MRKLLLAIIVLLYSLQSSYAQIPPAFANHLQYLLDSACAKNKVKGVTAAVLIPGMGVWKGSYGVSHDAVKITPDTWQPIGSNTKTFTAAILLQLQEEGKLDLDDSIGTWLQNIPNVNGKVTIRQMLNHTSGIYNFTNNPAFSAALNADYTKLWKPEDILQYIATPTFTPGMGWDYSNSGYILAGMIISKVLNVPYETALRNRILTPRNYNKTILFPQEPATGYIPHGWSVNASGGMKLEDIQVDYNYDNTAFQSMAGAAGGIVSTAEDNVRFWDDLMNGRIVNNTSLEELRTTVSMGGGANRYGLGVFRYASINGRVGYCHGGTCFGYINENFRDSLSGICITLLSNQDSINNSLLFSRILTPLHRYLIKLPTAAIAGAEAKPAVSIYPNPVGKKLYIKGLKSAAIATVYDMTGRQILQQSVNNNMVDAEQLPQGNYVLRLTTDDEHITMKFIKE